MHILNDPSGFFMKTASAPQGELLDLIKFLFSRSTGCTFNSFILVGVVLLGGLLTDSYPDTRSIRNSIARFSGSHVTGSKTLVNSFTSNRFNSSSISVAPNKTEISRLEFLIEYTILSLLLGCLNDISLSWKNIIASYLLNQSIAKIILNPTKSNTCKLQENIWHNNSNSKWSHLFPRVAYPPIGFATLKEVN